MSRTALVWWKRNLVYYQLIDKCYFILTWPKQQAATTRTTK